MTLRSIKKTAEPIQAAEPRVEAADTGERYTPENVLELVRAVAPIALDPCTTVANPTRAKAFLTMKDDGLKKVWRHSGLVYINPPFTRGILSRWVEKVIEESQRHQNRELLLLTPGDLGTKWAKTLHETAQAIAFMRGRINFIRPDGQYEQGAKQSSVIWYFGERGSRFQRVFAEAANVVTLPNVRRVVLST